MGSIFDIGPFSEKIENHEFSFSPQILEHLRIMANLAHRHLFLFQMKWGPIYGCPALHFCCGKICEIVCRVPREWVKSMFLCQDTNVMSLVDKCIVGRCFVCGGYLNSHGDGKVHWQHQGEWKWTRVWCWQSAFNGCRILRFRTSAIDLIHNERVSTSISSFFALPLVYSSHASMTMQKFWCHEYGTGSLYFLPFLKRSLSFI